MTDLYKEAARILRKANLKEGSLKTLVYSSTYRNLRQLFALVSESVKFQSVLKDVLALCGSSLLNEEMIECDHELALILLYEMLIGNGFGRAGFVRKVMRKYKAEIKAAQSTVLKENNAVSLADILKETSTELKAIPRYARVNLLKCGVDEAIEKLCEEGWEYVGKLNTERFQENITSLGKSQFGLDPLLDDLLVFPIKTDLHDHALVNDGILVLQDKASCVPARMLNPGAGCVVLDCCAAPGNKTSHLASLMRDQGRIIALDRDAKRMSTMKSLLERSGATSVETIVQDFLTLSPQSDEVSDIEMILVDPSCSGSGMPGSRLSSTDRDVNLERLQSLKRFQISLLKHALRFPNVQRVVYSTCSIHQQENEEVVEEVMSNVNKYFQFMPVFPEWPDCRGLERFPGHQNFLRLSSEKHLTAGFFVACFERKKSQKPNTVCEDESGECCNVDENGFDRGSELDKENIKKRHRDIVADDHEEEISSKRKKKKKDDSTEKPNTVCEDESGECCNVDENGFDRGSELVKEDRKKRHRDIVADDHEEEISSKRKKKKKDDSTETDEVASSINEDVEHSSGEKGRKNIRKEINGNEDGHGSDENALVEDFQNSNGKKKKKKKSKNKEESNPENVEDESSMSENMPSLSKKKKKKTKHRGDNILENIEASSSVSENIKDKSPMSGNVPSLSKKEKKKQKKDESEVTELIGGDEENSPSESVPSLSSNSKKKRKKKDKELNDDTKEKMAIKDSVTESGDSPSKKKKRKKCKD